MARQADDERKFDTGKWYNEWFDERRRYPSIVKVRIRAPIGAGSKVSIVVGPHIRFRDQLKCYDEPRYKDGYELPICVVRERLSEGTAYRLETGLKLIEQLQGLDPIEGLAYMFLLHLMLVDQRRAFEGKESALRGVTWVQAVPKKDRWRAQRELLRDPAGKLEHLLTNWERYGVRLAQGFGRPEDNTPGRPTYLVIPPLWISREDFDRFGGGRPTSVLISVDSTIAPFARHLIGSYKESARLGHSLDISIGPRDKPAKDVEELARYVFRWDGEHWKIVFDGNELPLLDDLKGLRIIQYLIRHRDREFPVLDLCRHVLDKPESPLSERGRAAAGGQTWKADEGMSTSGQLETPLERGTPEEHSRLKRDLRKMMDEVDDLKESGLEPSIEKQLEIDRIQQRLEADYDSKGRPRWDTGSRRKAQMRVNKLLNETHKKIKEYNPELERHLKNSVRRAGAIYSYRPDMDIDWRL